MEGMSRTHNQKKAPANQITRRSEGKGERPNWAQQRLATLHPSKTVWYMGMLSPISTSELMPLVQSLPTRE
jgi:hypothetical protein